MYPILTVYQCFLAKMCFSTGFIAFLLIPKSADKGWVGMTWRVSLYLFVVSVVGFIWSI